MTRHEFQMTYGERLQGPTWDEIMASTLDPTEGDARYGTLFSYHDEEGWSKRDQVKPEAWFIQYDDRSRKPDHA